MNWVSSNTFTDEENGISAKSTLYQQKEIPFLAVELTGQADGKDVWEYCFVTIVNGYSITLDMYSYDEITRGAESGSPVHDGQCPHHRVF